MVLPLGEPEITGFLDRDLQRGGKTISFYECLDRVKVKLEAREVKSWQNPARVFEEEAGALIQYFDWKPDGGKFIFEVKKKALAARPNRAGKMIIPGHHSW